MNAVRVPLIAGLAHGVGTSTLAAALHGQDRGRYSGGPVDVLVCRLGSLDAAAAVAGVPVLVVVADATVAATEQARARLGRARARCGAVVLLPHVAHLHESENPRSDAAGLLGLPPDLRPPALRPYADGLLAIVDALLRGGSLLRPLGPAPPIHTAPPTRPAPPTPTAPATTALRTPTGSPTPTGPPPVTGPTLAPSTAPTVPVTAAVPMPVAPAASSAHPAPLRRSRSVEGPPPVGEEPRPVRQTPVRLRAAAPTPQPIRVSPPVALRLVAGPATIRVTPTPDPARRVLPHPPPGSGLVPDDEALEAEPYLLPHLRTG